MLTIDQISKYFPEALLLRNPQGVLVEYLQHELLDSMFKEKGNDNGVVVSFRPKGEILSLKVQDSSRAFGGSE